AQGLVVFGIGLALTSGSLAALNAASSDPAHSTELAVLIAANLAATVLRFLLFRAWVFPDRDDDQPRTTVVAGHTPSYSTQQPYAPLPQRPTPHHQYATAPQPSYETTEFRAGEAAEQCSWRDATVQLQPVRPTDTDPRNS
ncbi:MAG: glycosyl transferase, partial [Streptomyces sp.]|nr:glycosyl transferase [Streptomyces sp.]